MSKYSSQQVNQGKDEEYEKTKILDSVCNGL